MRPLLTLVLILFTTISSFSQWHIGPKFSTGIIAQKAAVIPIMPISDYVSYHMEYIGSSQTRSLGFMAFNNLGPVFLQTELMATNYTLEFAVGANKNEAHNSEVYVENHYLIEVPFAAGVNIKNFKLGVGPVLEFNVEKESDLSIMEDYEDHSNKTDFGFHWMFGYRKGIFHVDIKYVYKFASLVDDFSFGYDEFMYKKSANRLSVGLGIAF